MTKEEFWGTLKIWLWAVGWSVVICLVPIGLFMLATGLRCSA